MDNDLSWNIEDMLIEYNKTLIGKIKEGIHNYRDKYSKHEKFLS